MTAVARQITFRHTSYTRERSAFALISLLERRDLRDCTEENMSKRVLTGIGEDKRYTRRGERRRLIELTDVGRPPAQARQEQSGRGVTAT